MMEDDGTSEEHDYLVYEALKIGKDMRRDEDLVACFREVMLLREQRKGKK